jgi:hypothetical protein
MEQAGRSRVRFPMNSLDFSIELILPAALCPGVDSASDRNEYQNLPPDKGRPVTKADNLTAICESIVWKIWEP